MRGSIRKRAKNTWTLIFDTYREVLDPATKQPRLGPDGFPLQKRKQRWVTYTGTKKQAEKELAKYVGADDGELTEPTKITLRGWLPRWLDSKGNRRPSTQTRYTGIIETILRAPMADLPLHRLRPSHVENYYATLTVSASTKTLHHTILFQALKKAAKDQLIKRNVAADIDDRPKRNRDRGANARLHCWSQDEARKVLATAKAADPQTAALYALALDTGARKGELCGLRWTDIDFRAGKICFARTLLKPGHEPTFGPTKTGHSRTLTVAPDTLQLLVALKRWQAEIKLKNGAHYRDFGLVFAKHYADLQRPGDMLGHPIQSNTLGERSLAKLVKQAGVKPIKFHGLRHTCATLLLAAGAPVHTVSERLGHMSAKMTLEVYAHVTPNLQQQAALTIGQVLYGGC